MLVELSLLLLGLIGLWIGSELAIRAAKNVAEHFRISAGFIGLTILSIGTSVPELATSVAGGISRWQGIETSGIVVGNIVGSAANLLTLILGIVALLGVLWVKARTLRREGIMLIGSILALGFLGFDGEFSAFDGAFMVLAYILYLFVIASQEKLHEKITGRRPELHIAFDVLILVGGLLLVAYASGYVVRNGVALSDIWGISQTFVGIFIVGLGTGLPELAVSLAAIRKREIQMSVGNLIGSNICDLLFSLGVGTVIAGFLVPKSVIFYDIPALLVISLVAISCFKYGGLKLTKKNGIILIALYLLYLGMRLYLFG